MVRLQRFAVALALSMTLAGAGGMTASAQDHHEHDHHPGGGPGARPGMAPGRSGVAPGRPGAHPGFRPGFHGGFHGHDFAHFTPGERALWVGGNWRHEFHNGRLGWWWAVGPTWYFYAAPIYPYPDYVADVSDDPTMGGPPAGVPAGAAPGYWYYCSATSTYYPYVQNCPVPWTPVTPTPPQQ